MIERACVLAVRIVAIIDDFEAFSIIFSSIVFSMVVYYCRRRVFKNFLTADFA